MLLLGVLVLAGCAPDPGCETLEWAFERQTERVRALSEYVDGAVRSAYSSAHRSVRDSILVARGFEAGDWGAWLDLIFADTAEALPDVDSVAAVAPANVLQFLHADTVEVLVLDLGLATTAVLAEMTVLEDADVQCPDRIWCDAFRQGVEATVAMWRVWDQLAVSDDGDSTQVSEDEGPALSVRRVAQELATLTERARPRAEAAGCACLPWSEAVAVWAAGGDRGPPDFDLEADTCWCETWGPVGSGWPHQPDSRISGSGDGTLPIWLPTWLRVPDPDSGWECIWRVVGAVLAFLAILLGWLAVGAVVDGRRPDLARKWWVARLWFGVIAAFVVGLAFIAGVNLTGSAVGGIVTVIVLGVGGLVCGWLDSQGDDPPNAGQYPGRSSRAR